MEKEVNLRFHGVEFTFADGARGVHAAGEPSLKNVDTAEVGTMVVAVVNDVSCCWCFGGDSLGDSCRFGICASKRSNIFTGLFPVDLFYFFEHD